MHGIIQFLLLAVSTLSAVSAAADIHGSVAVGIGRRLDPEEPETAVTVEPEAALYFGQDTGRIRVSSLIERPTDAYQNFRAPRTLAGIDFYVGSWIFTGSFNALELDRWATDGSMIRGYVGVERKQAVAGGLVVSLRAGPFYQWNRFSQRADGRSLPSVGFGERLRFEATLGRVLFDARFMLEQRLAGVWKNDFATYERIGFQIMPWLSAGLVHELLASIVDESTGTSRGVRFFDDRQSKVSVMAELTF